MKDNKHIQNFNRHQENLNISDAISSKKDYIIIGENDSEE
jgi:hypothetical protein